MDNTSIAIIEFINQDSPIVFGAIITGILAILGILIQTSVAFTKYKYEEKNDFENTLKEKLERVYAPLNMIFSKTKHKKDLINEEVLKIISASGYLLSNELIFDIKELYIVQIHNTIDSIDHTAEYNSLKEKIIDKLEREFGDLTSDYNNNFSKYKKNWSRTLLERIAFFFRDICIIITSIFWTIFIIILFISNAFSVSEPIFENGFLNFLTMLLAVVIVFTTILGTGFALSLFLAKWIRRISESKKRYQSGSYVPITGIYKCRICKSEHKIIRNSRFPFYKHIKIKHKILFVILDSPWELTNEIITKQKKGELRTYCETPLNSGILLTDISNKHV